MYELPELQPQAETLLTLQAGSGILVIQIMFYPVNPFFKIDCPGVSSSILFDLQINIALANLWVKFMDFIAKLCF
jgi:hypothetical protein